MKDKQYFSHVQNVNSKKVKIHKKLIIIAQHEGLEIASVTYWFKFLEYVTVKDFFYARGLS